MKKIAKLMTLALAVITLASCEDVPSPFGTVTPPKTQGESSTVEPAGDGTAANPFNIAAAIAKCKEIGSTESTEKYYVKGVVVNAGAADATYGNASFYMADEEDTSSKFYAFQVLGSDGKKMTAGYAINVGDVVVIYGPIYNYKGNTPETAGKGAAYIVTINGKRTDEGSTTPTGEYGTKDAPLTVAKALEVINGLEPAGSVSPAYVKGKISKVQSFNDKYKSITYYISDDGSDTNALQVYSGKGLDGADFAAQTDLQVGWTVVVTGELKKYVNSNTGATTPEINQSSTIVSIDKTTGGGETTPGGEAKGSGTEADPFNIAAAIAKCKEVGETASTENYYIKGIADDEYTVTSYKNVEINIVDTEGSSEKFKVFRVKDKDGKGIKEGYKIEKGATIIVYGPVVNYKGNTPETATGAYLVSVNGKAPELDGETSGGDDNTGGGETSGGSTITAAFGDLDCSNIASIKLSDGTVIAVAQEDGKSAPIYHESTKILRIYARNSVTINAGSKKISKVELAYDTYNGTAYKGNDEMYGEAGGSKISPAKDDKNVTFSNVNSSTLKVVNWLESGNSGGTQFRITGITITYAQ